MDFYHIFWFDLIGPVLVPTVFVMAIMYKLDCRHPDTPIAWRRVLGIPLLFFLPLCAAMWFFVGRYAFKENSLLFNGLISNFQSIQIIPGTDSANSQLTDDEIMITNRSSIREIMEAIRAAKPYHAQHSHVRWQCFMVVSNLSDVSYISACDEGTFEYPKGVVIIYCETSLGGYTYNSLSNNDLGDILEKLTGYRAITYQ